MARINQGFLGNASGKLGNVVFAKWRRLFTARQYQPEIHDANSPDQQKQRTRMVTLLQFLKPLNKTFIKSYNSPYSKNSTSWAKAIKDNMPAVSPEGCISLKNFVLGELNLPPLNVIGASYDPFIDQIQLTYQMQSIPVSVGNFPYIGISALGKYKSSDGTPSFDIRHLMCCEPEGLWHCILSDNMEQSFYLNYWEEGRLWFIIDEDNFNKHTTNPFQNISATAYFKVVPLIGSFNTNVKDNFVPVDALTWEYNQGSNDWYLQFHIDFSKTQLISPADYTLRLWTVTMANGNHLISGSYDWDLQESEFEVILGPSGLTGSVICLYSIFTKQNVQVSRFNRFYISKGSNGIDYPLLQQIFDCNYSHPASFQLSGNQCGFCGAIDELFSDFIELFEQGIIAPDQNPTPVEYNLTIDPVVNGNIVVTGYKYIDTGIYYFNEGETAQLQIVPDSGYLFDIWTGPDVIDLLRIDDTHYSILMSKNRELSASFNGTSSNFNILTIFPTVNGHFNIAGYDHNIGDNYYFMPEAVAAIALFPEPGMIFSHWEGTGASFLVEVNPNNWRLMMSTNYSLQVFFD